MDTQEIITIVGALLAGGYLMFRSYTALRPSRTGCAGCSRCEEPKQLVTLTALSPRSGE